MARQRNNLARLPWEIREIACRLHFDGAGNATIARAVAKACRAAGLPEAQVHGTTILAYTRSEEYRRYCDLRREWDERTERRRWAAKCLHDGRGPQSVADLAEVEILEQLHALAAGGLLETGKDVATVARAITAMQRTQLARQESALRREIEKLHEAHAADLDAKDNRIAQLENELAQWRRGGREVDATVVAERMDEVLGVRK